MILELIASIDKRFLQQERAHFKKDPHEHTQKISERLKQGNGGRASRSTINFYLLLERHWGPSAAFGFVTILGTLSRFSEHTGDKRWLESQLTAVESVNSEVVTEYTTSFVNHPVTEVARIDREIKDSPFHAFMESFTEKWGHNFEVGAYGIIGLLQLCEPDSVKTLCE